MNNAASIKARLRNLAAKEHKPYDYVQTHYMIERLLYRLSISKYADDFVLKGGLLLHVLFADKARATRDIDFLARFTSNPPENLKASSARIKKLQTTNLGCWHLALFYWLVRFRQ